MQIIAVSSDKRHILVETEKDKGYIEDKQTGAKTDEKSIVSLLSANIDWEDPEEPIIDAYTPEIYDYLDKMISKSGFQIEGQQLPRKAKTVGLQTELLLYSTLKDKIDEFLSTLSEAETEVEVLKKFQDFMSQWYGQNEALLNKAFQELFKTGIAAGVISAGVKTFTPEMAARDIKSINLLAAGKYRIGERIRLFGDDLVEQFAGIITKAYTPEGQFSLDWLTNEMKKVVPAQRFALERIARTETNNISGAGRIWAWSADPERYKFQYRWLSTPDSRRRKMKEIRSNGNPYDFDGIVFLFLNNEQLVDGYWTNGNINCRCSVSRYPVDEEFHQPDRFVRQDHLYRKTMDFDFV